VGRYGPRLPTSAIIRIVPVSGTGGGEVAGAGMGAAAAMGAGCGADEHPVTVIMATIAAPAAALNLWARKPSESPAVMTGIVSPPGTPRLSCHDQTIWLSVRFARVVDHSRMAMCCRPSRELQIHFPQLATDRPGRVPTVTGARPAVLQGNGRPSQIADTNSLSRVVVPGGQPYRRKSAGVTAREPGKCKWLG
jgi:hypothetical protein